MVVQGPEPVHPDIDSADKLFRLAGAEAEELGMRPLVARCHLGLGKLYRRTGDHQRAQEHLTATTAQVREMDMRFWPEQEEAELKELGSKSTKKTRRRT